MALLDVSGAVLIGGRSRRMGEPKALMRLEPTGPTLLERVVASLAFVAAEVLLVGAPAWELPGTLAGSPTTRDRGESAIDGVIAALAVARHERCVVVGCDMPFLDPGLISAMCAVADREDAGVMAVDSSGANPLLAVYRRSSLPTLEALVSSGKRSLTRAARVLEMAPFRVDGSNAPPAWRWSVVNVNTPADLEEARRHARATA
jgi:molybdopterin-guanine dinucleotide biosynthesis protein A